MTLLLCSICADSTHNVQLENKPCKNNDYKNNGVYRIVPIIF